MSFSRIKSALISAARGGSSNYMGALTLNTVAGVGHNLAMSTASSASGNFLLQALESNNSHNYPYGNQPTFRSSVMSALDSLGLLRHQKDSLTMFTNYFLVTSSENVLATLLGYGILGVVGAQTGTLGQVVSDAVVGTIPYALMGTMLQLMSASTSTQGRQLAVPANTAVPEVSGPVNKI